MQLCTHPLSLSQSVDGVTSVTGRQRGADAPASARNVPGMHLAARSQRAAGTHTQTRALLSALHTLVKERSLHATPK